MVQAAIGADRLTLDTFTAISAVPGSPDQPWHCDVDPLWLPGAPWTGAGGGGEQGRLLPPHGVVAVIPLLNVSRALGPTEFAAGSHVQDGPPAGWWKARDSRPPAGVLAPLASVGDVVLFDLRVRHRGSANRANHTRPLLYVSYTQEWFTDSRVREWASIFTAFPCVFTAFPCLKRCADLNRTST